MNKVINLELADKYSYKNPFKETYRDLNFVDIIFEILGSVKPIFECDRLDINIYITQENIFVSHNGEPLDQDDMERLLKMATHSLKKNKKGVSKQGVGWRAIATVSSNKNFNDEEYNIGNHLEYSSMISRINSDINIENDKLKKNNVVSLIHDNDFQIMIKTDKFYDDIYRKYLKHKYGVLFIIPNKQQFYHNQDREIVHKLKLLFNRLDCDITYHNEITSFNKEIFKNKPFYYVDKNIKNNKYLECKCEMFTYKNKKGLKMNIIHNNNVELEYKSHYFYIPTFRNIDEIMTKYEYEDWNADIENMDEIEFDNYSFNFRMMGFDPDKHLSNQDFKKWFNYYSPDSDNQSYAAKIEGYYDGIIPYVDNYCLKYSTNETQKGYLKQKDFHPSKFLLRSTNGAHCNSSWKRTINNKIISYKPKQNFLCELIETRENIDNGNSLLSLNPVKSKTNVCDAKGFPKTIPFFLLWLSHKYLWFTSEEEINELTTEEQLELQKKETEKEKQLKKDAENKLMEEHKQKLLIQQKLEKEKFEKEEEQKKTEHQKKLKIKAQEKAKDEERKKLIQKEKAKKEEQEKIIAQQKAAEEEHKKQLALQKASEEEHKKQLALQKAVEEGHKKQLALQKAAEEEHKKQLALQKAAEEEHKKQLAQQKAEQEEFKKKKSMLNNQKLVEVLQETANEKEELENELENEYIPINDEKNVNEGHCYCIVDPTRPHYRKIGISSKNESDLEKQYIKRYMPEGVKIIHWEPFDNLQLAEKMIIEKLKKYRINDTEWFKFTDRTENEMNEFINKIFNGYKNFIKE
jgi:hypothetical protein